MTFYTSLSGLQAATTDMSVISNNLANVATTGFKKSRSQFADVMASNLASDPSKLVGSGVVVQANRQQFSEGNLTTTSSALDLTISGDGFFAVKTDTNNPATDYTRNGSFEVNNDGYVTDGQGSFLQVYPVDSQGNATATGADGLTNLKLPQTSGTPVATSAVSLDVNVSSNATAPTKAFDRTDSTTYNNSAATTVYDANGNAETMTNYYVKGATGTDGSTTWNVYSYLDSQPLKVNGSTDSVAMTFDATGTMTQPTGAVTFDSIQPANSTTPQKLTLDLSGSTQGSAAFSVASRSQDGKAAGQLSGVSVDDSGVVSASFSNGDTQKLGMVAIANFNNPTGLRQLGDSYWAQTGTSGTAKLGSAGQNGFGGLMSGTLEGSNVDITEELVNLISAQRNFQANSKALDTQSQTIENIVDIRS